MAKEEIVPIPTLEDVSHMPRELMPVVYDGRICVHDQRNGFVWYDLVDKDNYRRIIEDEPPVIYKAWAFPTEYNQHPDKSHISGRLKQEKLFGLTFKDTLDYLLENTEVKVSDAWNVIKKRLDESLSGIDEKVESFRNILDVYTGVFRFNDKFFSDAYIGQPLKQSEGGLYLMIEKN